MNRHCVPSGLAFGKPKGELREAISIRTCMSARIAIASAPAAPRNDIAKP
jgi:hypothetical protein